MTIPHHRLSSAAPTFHRHDRDLIEKEKEKVSNPFLGLHIVLTSPLVLNIANYNWAVAARVLRVQIFRSQFR
jgi:hypothetical protein